MSKYSFFLRVSSLALLALASVPRVSAVCGTNAIGLANAPAGAIIVNNDCAAVDTKEIGDFNVCGEYEGGSQAVCRTPFTPSTIHTLDGLDWGNCVASTEKCGTDDSTDQPNILWCCPAL
ncbi:hypothetical protein ACEPAH_9298 [Sanghuangporus vaninii]